MVLIINVSNLSVGGGVQVALSFINDLKCLNRDNVYHVFLSLVASEQIDKDKFPENFYFYLISHSPAPLKYRNKVIIKLNSLESKINPDVVFSVFGPTFWCPKSPHVMGFALGWLINPGTFAFKELSFIKRFFKHLEIKYKAFYVKKNADYYITETNDTKNRLSRIYDINKDKVFVVGNTCNSFFNLDHFKKIYIDDEKENEFRMIAISSNYPHKNFRIIRAVIPYLKSEKLNYKFVLTIDDETYNKMFTGFYDDVINLGPIKSELCPSAYSQCDALFLPTLLECFTASYPEAMKMNKPILTSYLPFAKEICGDAAIYFNPLDPADIADKIIKLSKNLKLQNELIDKGKKKLVEFETAATRAEKYVKICENISCLNFKASLI